jgi:hypothetical protein
MPPPARDRLPLISPSAATPNNNGFVIRVALTLGCALRESFINLTQNSAICYIAWAGDLV